MAFTTIELAADLPARDRQAARAAAPPAAATRKPYLHLLGTAGFFDVGRRNITAEYERVTTQSLQEYRRHSEALAEAVGEDFVADRLATWGAALTAIRQGWLQRYLYWAHQKTSASGPDRGRRTSPGSRPYGPA